MNNKQNDILAIKNLRVSFHTYAGEVQAVRDISYRKMTMEKQQIWLGKAGQNRL